MSDARLQSAVEGCIFGALVGDALGALLEGSGKPTKEKVAQVWLLQGKGLFGLSSGQLSDAGEMILCHLRGLLDAAATPTVEGGVPNFARATAKRYRMWAISNPVELPNPLQKAFAKSTLPGSPDEKCRKAAAAANATSMGNDALARMPPIACLLASMKGLSTAEARRLVEEEVNLTHPHSVVIDGCVAYVLLLAHLLSHPNDVVGAFQVAASETKTAEVRRWLADAVAATPLESTLNFGSSNPAAATSVTKGGKTAALPECWPKARLMNVPFIHALRLLAEGVSWEVGITRILMGGGDSSANASVAGAVLGALWGPTAIPAGSLKTVLDCDTMATKLRQRATIYQVGGNIRAEIAALLQLNSGLSAGLGLGLGSENGGVGVQSSDPASTFQRIQFALPENGGAAQGQGLGLAQQPLALSIFNDTRNPHGIVNFLDLSLASLRKERSGGPGTPASAPPKRRAWSALQADPKREPTDAEYRKFATELESFRNLPNWEHPDLNSSYWIPIHGELHPPQHPGYAWPEYAAEGVKREQLRIRTNPCGYYEAGRPNPPDYDEEVTPREALRSGMHHGSSEIRDNAFLLHKLLTVEECNYIVAKATPHVVPVDKYFEHRYRKSDRALIRAPKLTAELYRRILPMLRGDDYKGRIPLCFGQKGVWVPFGLNDVVKINHYGVGGMFAQHRDGPWIPREDQASIYTVIIYLTEEFSGGLTCLFQSHGSPNEKAQVVLDPLGQRGLERIKTPAIVPTIGTALLFNHDMWHAASPVMNAGPRGKYILRTELIFQKVHSLYVDRFAFALEEDFRDLVQLYKKSQDALAAGNRREFVDLYQEVVDRQRTAMLDSWGQAPPLTRAFLSPALNFDTQSRILGFLSVREVTQLMLLCRAAYYQIVQSDFWEERCFAEYGPSVAGDQAVLQHSSVTGSFKSRLPLDWYTIYGQRQLMKKHEFQPVALVITPHGAEVAVHRNQQQLFFDRAAYRGATPSEFLAYFRIYPDDVKKVSKEALWLAFIDEAERNFVPSRDEAYEDDPENSESHHTESPSPPNEGANGSEVLTDEAGDQFFRDGYLKSLRIYSYRSVEADFNPPVGFWTTTLPNIADDMSGDAVHLNITPEERFQFSFELPSGEDSPDESFVCEARGGQVRWDLLSSLVELAVNPVWNPTFLVGHPGWFVNPVGSTVTSKQEEDPTDPRYRALLDLFELTRTPAIHLVHPASVSLMVLGSLTGNRADATPKLHSLYHPPTTALPWLDDDEGGQYYDKWGPFIAFVIPAEDHRRPFSPAVPKQKPSHSGHGYTSRLLEEAADLNADTTFYICVVDRRTSRAIRTVRAEPVEGPSRYRIVTAVGDRVEEVQGLTLESVLNPQSYRTPSELRLPEGGANPRIPLFLQVLTYPSDCNGDWRSGRCISSIWKGSTYGGYSTPLGARLTAYLHWTSLKKRWEQHFPSYPLTAIHWRSELEGAAAFETGSGEGATVTKGSPTAGCYSIEEWTGVFPPPNGPFPSAATIRNLGFDEWVQLPPSQRLPDPDITNYVLSPDQFYALGVIPAMNSLQFRSVCQFRPVLLESGIPPVPL
jgi:ADP-ribosylglycohydrolase